MATGKTFKTGEGEWDGKMPIFQSCQITAANATTKAGRFIAPCDGTIVSMPYRINATITNAAGALSFGTEAAPTANLTSYDIHNVTGTGDLVGSLASAVITKNQSYTFQLVDADTTGDISIGVVIMPN